MISDFNILMLILPTGTLRFSHKNAWHSSGVRQYPQGRNEDEVHISAMLLFSFLFSLFSFLFLTPIYPITFLNIDFASFL